MKLKELRLFGILSFLLIALFTMNSCNDELDSSEVVDVREFDLSNYDIEVTSYKHLKGINNVLDSKMQKDVKNNQNNLNLRVDSEEYNFSFDEDNVQVIETDNYTSYTFIVERNDETPFVLENYMLIQYVDGTYNQYLLNYHYSIDNDGNYIYDEDQIDINEIFDDSIVQNRIICVPELVDTFEGTICTSFKCTGTNPGNHEYGDDECQCGTNPILNCTPATITCDTGIIYVYEDNCSSDTPDPDNGDSDNSNTSGGSGSGGNTFIVIPNNENAVDVPSELIRQLELSPLTDSYLIDWINDNYGALGGGHFIIEEIFASMVAGGFSQMDKDNAILKLTYEYINDSSNPQWDTSVSGILDNNPILQYDAKFELPGYGGTRVMYRLVNQQEPALNHKQVLLVSSQPYNINGQYDNTIAPTDINLDGAYHYLYSTETEEWYEYGLPIPEYDCLACDLNDMFEWFLTNTLTIAGRYFLPIEDVIILIDGKDFEGVEQSRAVAAAFLIIDRIPGGQAFKLIKGIKYADEAIQAGEVLIKKAHNFYDTIARTQRDIINNVLDGVEWYELDLLNNTVRKGNFGEMVTDVDMYTKGYEPKHIRTTNLDDQSVLDNGIDHVFQNPETGEYIIVESKFNTSTLDQNVADGPQMSNAWIEGSNRLVNAVGDQSLADEIINAGYIRVVANISEINGYIQYKLLNHLGQPIGTWTP